MNKLIFKLSDPSRTKKKKVKQTKKTIVYIKLKETKMEIKDHLVIVFKNYFLF